jgi:hypothetical protein
MDSTRQASSRNKISGCSLSDNRGKSTLSIGLIQEERLEVEAEIRRLQEPAPIVVAMGPGYFNESPFFPCAPRELQELNVDYQGNVTLCCHLSGYSRAHNRTDFMGNLGEISLSEAVERSQRMVATYLGEKRAKVARGEFSRLDHFPCWYCLKHLDKVSWLRNFPNHPWARDERRNHDNVRTAGSTSF